VLLGHPRFAARGIFEARVVRRLVERHTRGEDHSSRLCALRCLDLRFRMFADDEIGRHDSLHDFK